MELQAGESLVILSYTRRIRKNEEKRYSCSMIKMADNIWSLLEDWYDSLGMAEELGGSGSQEAG